MIYKFSTLLQHFTLFTTSATHGNRLPDNLRVSPVWEVSCRKHCKAEMSDAKWSEKVCYQGWCFALHSQGPVDYRCRPAAEVRIELEWTMQDCGTDQQRNIPPTEWARKAAQAGCQQQPPKAFHQSRIQKWGHKWGEGEKRNRQWGERLRRSNRTGRGWECKSCTNSYNFCGLVRMVFIQPSFH